jgi:hypothetical protein
MAGFKKQEMLEQHYSPAQLAERWGFSVDFVRKLFRFEEGVILVDRPERMHKRGYANMRIPESVAERVYSRMTTRKRPTFAKLASPEAQRLA